MNLWIAVGAVLMMLAVIFGAFGAHALENQLDDYSMTLWGKASLYHLVHGMGVLLVALLGSTVLPKHSSTSICILLTVSTIIFSGSLYLLAITGIKWLGAITPIGGTGFIVAWAWLAYAAWSASA